MLNGFRPPRGAETRPIEEPHEGDATISEGHGQIPVGSAPMPDDNAPGLPQALVERLDRQISHERTALGHDPYPGITDEIVDDRPPRVR